LNQNLLASSPSVTASSASSSSASTPKSFGAAVAAVAAVAVVLSVYPFLNQNSYGAHILSRHSKNAFSSSAS